MSRQGAPTPEHCPSQHPVTEANGDRVLLTCSINDGHDGTHQAYYRDRLHHWTDQPLKGETDDD